MNDNLIISERIGLNTPTVVYHKGERLETVGLDIETLVKTWCEKWFKFEYENKWIVLACSDREYSALQQRPLHARKTVQELFYEHKVICINRKPIEDNAIAEYSAKCEAEHDKFINELGNKNMTETEVRDLIDKLQQTLTETKNFGITALSEISAYVVDKKLDINELKNEIVNLKCERNDWKQRAESAKQRYDSLIQSSAECTSKKIQNVLQDLYNQAKCGTQDENNDFAFACNQMKDKILVKAKEYGVEIKI